MASTHKTFTSGAILTAPDVNNALNPDTADHIPYAMTAGGSVVYLTNNAQGTAAITFPAGRFTQPPILVVNRKSWNGIRLSYYNVTKDGAVVQANTTSGTAQTLTVDFSWVAVQMTPTSAAG